MDLSHGLYCSGSCVLVLRCGSAGVVWYPQRVEPQRNTNTHRTRAIQPMRQIHNKSQAPEDECTNIRNMLSSK